MAFIPKQKKNEAEEQRLDAKDQSTPGVPRFSGAGFAPSATANKPLAGGGPSMAGNPNSPMAGGGDFGRFVSIGEYLGQNQNQAQGMANKLSGSGETAGKDAQRQVNNLETSFNRGLQRTDKSIYGANATSYPGTGLESANPAGYEAASRSTQNASDYNKNLGTFGGVQDNLRSAYGNGGYSGNETQYDAALAGQAGGGRFAQLSSKYGNLGQALADANSRSTAAYDTMSKRNAAWDAEQERKRREAEKAREKEREDVLAAMGRNNVKVGQSGLEPPEEQVGSSGGKQPDFDLDLISPDKKKPYPSR